MGKKLLVQKIIQYVLVFIVILSLNFLLPRLMPGNPLMFLAGEEPGRLTAEQREAILAQHGLDKPLFQQYLIYLGNTLQGDLGYSYRQARPVTEIVLERLPWTLLLTGSNLLLATIIGVGFGAIAAWKRKTRLDAFLLTIFMFLSSMPSFWIAMILVAIFSTQLGWFPHFGAESAWGDYSGFARLVDILRHLFLPMVSLLVLSLSAIFMTMRYSMLNVLGEDYILMARAKGVPEKRIKYKHATRNALLPVITLFMLQLGFIFGGATVVETVFSYPGLGRLMYQSVMGRDYPVLQGAFLLISIAVLLGNLMADLIYPLFDPKVGSKDD